MKAIKFIPVLLLFMLSSCGSSITVYSDFDKSADFSQYKTYAFNKKAIDKVQISSLDKKRILQAIETELDKKGMTKSENPDLTIGIFTKEKEQVDVTTSYFGGWGGFGYPYRWGFGYNPYNWGGYPYVNTAIEGKLFIDFVDTKKNELVWQGEGVGYLTKNRSKKEAIINDFVIKILMQYPPALEKK